MIVVLKRGSTDAQIAEVVARLEEIGLGTRVVRRTDKPLIHVVSGATTLAKPVLKMERVQALVRTRGPRIRREGRRFFPFHFINACIACLLVLGALTMLAGFFPPGLGDRVDVRVTPVATAPTWYLRALSAFIDLFPPRLAWLPLPLVGLTWLAIVFLPVLDRSQANGFRSRLPVVAIGLFLLAAAIALSLRAAH
jgi:quinol-cytochrome oxidoreductase complex cytochrome b subunit